MKKYKKYFAIIVFLIINCSFLFGQKKIDCAFLAIALKDQLGCQVDDIPIYNTIYLYEEDSIKYFTNCDVLQIGKYIKCIVTKEVPKNINFSRSQILFIHIVEIKAKTIKIVFVPLGIDNKLQRMAMTVLTYRKKHGKYKLIAHGQS